MSAASGWTSDQPGPMTDVVFLILRRMRTPLILLIVTFTICTFGLALMPGVDLPDGTRAERLTFFDAFYVISYTATTIGFGEIPGPFSIAQRMWMTLSIFMTVTGWYYTLVTILALVQERTFQTALRMGRFTRRVRSIREPFYIVCGAGETGTLVCRGLDRLGWAFVVIERDEDRLQALRLSDFHLDAPMIGADASQPAVLQEAGLLSPFCRGVVAVVHDDESNQAIAVTTRLLAPRVPVLARIRDSETETHVGVFGGDLVINPFERFAEQLGAAVSAPQRYRLREILTGLEGDPLPEQHHPPHGHWIVCGYGRFGRAVVSELRAGGNTVSVIDVENYAAGGVDVNGTGTDSVSLGAAGMDEAVGIVAGNSSDTKNLAIAVTARDLKPGIFIVTRENQAANAPLFEAFTDDLAMVPSRIVASEFLARITTPLLVRYLNRIPTHNEDECKALADALGTVNGGRMPVIWSLRVDAKNAPGLTQFLADGGELTLAQLRSSYRVDEEPLSALVLLVVRGRRVLEAPSDDLALERGDEVLFAGDDRALRLVQLRVENQVALEMITNTNSQRGGYLWHRLFHR
ncbi:MAG: NAD-binding protein [Propionibacteriaceae bacterium]|nr:NAD-binding protein [Propionibacteriaceae bacterium]